MASVGTASSVVEPPRIAEAGLAVERERVWGNEQGSSGQRLTPGLVRGGASTGHWIGWSQRGAVGWACWGTCPGAGPCCEILNPACTQRRLRGSGGRRAARHTGIRPRYEAPGQRALTPSRTAGQRSGANQAVDGRLTPIYPASTSAIVMSKTRHHFLPRRIRQLDLYESPEILGNFPVAYFPLLGQRPAVMPCFAPKHARCLPT